MNKNLSLVIGAAIFAEAAHAAVGQKRKYTNEPYIVHPIAVAGLVSEVGGTPEMIAAAYLHDVVEDTQVKLPLILSLFGGVVAGYVEGLTHQFTSEAFPHMNRAARKQKEKENLALQSNEVKTIKLADLIDNSSSIMQYDPGFAKVYLKEKEELLEVLVGGSPELLARAHAIIARSSA